MYDLPPTDEKEIAIIYEEWEEIHRYSMWKKQKLYLGSIKAAAEIQCSEVPVQ